MRFVLTAALVLMAQGAWADGFAILDFTKVKVVESDYAGGTYDSLSENDRIILACEDCDDLTSVVMQLGRSTDGTEGRFRSGETTIEKMRGICQDRNPKCQLTRLDVGDAVGWVTQYSVGQIEGSTAVLFLDGDLLTIRSTSDSRNRVGSNMAAALQNIAPQIVGSK